MGGGELFGAQGEGGGLFGGGTLEQKLALRNV